MVRKPLSGPPRLPILWLGARRGVLVALVGTGVGQAAVATATALWMPQLLNAHDPHQQGRLAVLLVGLALGVGGLRVAERILGEKLGQHYVHEIRIHLVRAALIGRGPSIGVTIARATNDLTSVRNWVVWGIVPLLVGIPLIVGSLVALALLSPVLLAVVSAPLILLALGLLLVAEALRERTAALRRARGRLAGRLADTVAASETIAVAGGTERELRRIESDSESIVAAAVRRAVVCGWVRGAAAGVATLSMVLIAVVGAFAGLDAPTLATAFIVVGMMATPVSDLGRLSEYRQSYRVAERILGPEVKRSHQSQQRRGEASRSTRTARGGTVHIADLVLDGRTLPELVAEPGEVIVPQSADPAVLERLAAALRQPGTVRGAWLTVGGEELTAASPKRWRVLLGYASPRLQLERGTIARALRYRRPEVRASVSSALAEVGLRDAVGALPQGERTLLRRGGEPLSAEQRVLLLIARAWYGDPPLMVLDRVDAALGAESCRLLARGLRQRSGVTLLFSDHAENLAPTHRVWDVDATQPCLPSPRKWREGTRHDEAAASP